MNLVVGPEQEYKSLSAGVADKVNNNDKEEGENEVTRYKVYETTVNYGSLVVSPTAFRVFGKEKKEKKKKSLLAPSHVAGAGVQVRRGKGERKTNNNKQLLLPEA